MSQAKLITLDAKAKAPKDRFRARELKRVLLLACQHRTPLVLGLLCTVAFACLHTVSVGGAFPVFKVLLEEENPLDWVNRTVASARWGVDFAKPNQDAATPLRDVHTSSPFYDHGVRSLDRVWDADGRPAIALLHDLANAPAGMAFGIRVGESRQDAKTISVTAPPLNRKWRIVRWAASLVPAGAAENKLRTLAYLLVGLVVIIALANGFRYFGEVLIAEAILRSMMQLRTTLYERSLQLPMSFFATQSTSDLVGRFVQDIQEIQRGLLAVFSKFIREPLGAVFILALAFALDWRITLTLLLVTPPAVLIFWRVGRSVKKSNRKLLQAYGLMIGALTSTLQNLRVVRAYTAEEHERERLATVDRRVLRQQLKLARLQALVSPLMETIGVMGGCVLTVWLASRVLHRELEISRFATLGVALSLLFDPLRKMTDVYVRVMRSTAGAERIFHVIDQPVEAELSNARTELAPLRRKIEFLDVTFTYPGAQTPALNQVRAEIRCGETVALVGPNGCGKTTLVSILPRFFDPQEGRILFDGIDIREASLASLRRQIGLVTQDAVVFAGSAAENIAFGRTDVDEQRVIEASRRASAHEFLSALPSGYHADLGERGSTLSGGQKQRIAIARAIYRDAPILIFDEATSQIDSESEREIQEALREFARNRTTIIIAHRLSTIQFADRIIVMDNGRVIDSGTHEELLDTCSLYKSLCETQFVIRAPTN